MATASPARRRASAPKSFPVEPRPDFESLCIRMPASGMTLDTFHDWLETDPVPEWVRVCYIEGEVYLDMSLEDLDTHATLKRAVCVDLEILNRRLKIGTLFLDGARISHEGAVLSTRPDAVLVRRATFRSGKVRLVPKKKDATRYTRLEGTPDWVLEIISDSSVAKDNERLRTAYHKAGVPEYWLIDARGEAIDFQLLLWKKSGYAAAPVKDGWQSSRVFGHAFRLERQRDEFGLWEYTLLVRPEE